MLLRRIGLLAAMAFLPVFAPAVASADEQWLLVLKDGSTSCGRFLAKGNAYCRYIAGGELCWQKSEVMRISRVEDCSAVEIGAGTAPPVVKTLKRNSFAHTPQTEEASPARSGSPSAQSGPGATTGTQRPDGYARPAGNGSKASGDNAWWHTGGSWSEQNSSAKKDAR